MNRESFWRGVGLSISVAIVAGLAVMCATPTTTLQSVEYTCASATALLRAATVANLAPAAAGHVSHAVAILNPICSQPTPPTLDSTAHAALTSALSELTAAVPQQ